MPSIISTHGFLLVGLFSFLFFLLAQYHSFFTHFLRCHPSLRVSFVLSTALHQHFHAPLTITIFLIYVLIQNSQLLTLTPVRTCQICIEIKESLPFKDFIILLVRQNLNTCNSKKNKYDKSSPSQFQGKDLVILIFLSLTIPATLSFTQ